MDTPGLDGRGKGGGPWRMVKISSFSSDEQSSRSRKETVGLSRFLWPPLAASILKLEHFEEPGSRGITLTWRHFTDLGTSTGPKEVTEDTASYWHRQGPSQGRPHALSAWPGAAFSAFFGRDSKNNTDQEMRGARIRPSSNIFEGGGDSMRHISERSFKHFCAPFSQTINRKGDVH